jgi:hypothetical protein
VRGAVTSRQTVSCTRAHKRIIRIARELSDRIDTQTDGENVQT